MMAYKTLKQTLKAQLKKDLYALLNKYADTDKEQEEVYNLMRDILNEGF